MRPAKPSEAATAWHATGVDEAAAALGADLEHGLRGAEAQARLQRHGPNELAEQAPRSWLRMLADQFTDFMIVVLVAAAVVSGVVGEPEDALAIVVIVVLNAIIGFVQEYRAERAIAALRRLAAATATVVRDGERCTLPASALVPGDLVVLEAGGVVPADLRLVEAAQLRVDESLLTGESVTVEKDPRPLPAGEPPLGERVNMAFKGTLVAQGRGLGLVVASGMATELGRIAALIEGAGDQKTPLQRRLAAFGRRLAFVVLGICAVVFAAGLLRGEPPVLMFLTAVSLAVAAIPEALPAVVTILLALGARRMVAQNALIRRLPAVETLGSVTYVCSDKTGTLTQNRMTLHDAFAGGRRLEPLHASTADPDWAVLLQAMALNNDATLGEHGKPLGDPTEVALLVAAAAADVEKPALEARLPRVLELPFDADRKRMTTFHRDADCYIAYTKGAPEAVLGGCDTMLVGGREAPVDRAAVAAEAERLAAEGLRVLALAQRRWAALPRLDDAQAVETGLVFLGLVGLIDPPRPEAREAVDLCRTAGIVPVMITGDHPATARAIATRLGILDGAGEVLTGARLAALSDAELRAAALRVRVYARVDPAQKIRIVEALQAGGQFVAMTGDGVNDAPALKRADIGVAMGRDGTDVAREASSLVLLDDNFATIVGAVREGRRIFDNIRKFVRYAMTGNAAEILTIFVAPFLGLPIPLLPIHILWVNLVTDGLPGLALAAEPAERGVMRRPPRPPGESLFAQGMGAHIVWAGALMAALCVATQAWGVSRDLPHWQTMVFTVLTLSQMGHVLAIRSERDSLFTQGLRSNLPLAGAVLLTFALQLAVIYVPWLQPVFHTAPLTAAELAACLLLSMVVFVAVEIEKAVRRRARRRGAGPGPA